MAVKLLTAIVSLTKTEYVLIAVAVVGVPETSPVLEFIEIPVGKEGVTVNLYVPLPPEAVTGV